MINPKLQEQFTCSVQMKGVIDQSRNVETCDITLRLPALGTASLTLKTRGCLDVLGKLITLQSPDSSDEKRTAISLIKFTGRDDGLVSFLLSDQFKDRDETRKFFESFVTEFSRESEPPTLFTTEEVPQGTEWDGIQY